MNALTQELVDLLSLEKLEENIFRGQSRNLVGKRVFGGQVLGQALRAASYTTDRPAHSLHAYFLFGGDINAPIIYEVDRIRDGRSFVSRQVRAIQHGKTIFHVYGVICRARRRVELPSCRARISSRRRFKI